MAKIGYRTLTDKFVCGINSQSIRKRKLTLQFR